MAAKRTSTAIAGTSSKRRASEAARDRILLRRIVDSATLLRRTAVELEAAVKEREQVLRAVEAGVIQDIYAVGLALEAARENKAGGGTIVKAIGRGVTRLNKVIRSVRRHIGQSMRIVRER